MGIGAELTWVRVGHGRFVVGAGGGAAALSEQGSVRAWTDLVLGWRVTPDLGLGLSLGPTASFDPPRHPWLGGQATLWLWHGATPFVRVGSLQGEGTFIDLGLALLLPAIRW